MNKQTSIRLAILMYLVPIVGIYLFVILLPLIKGVWYSLNEILYYKLTFTGIQNYIELFNDQDFWFSLGNNFVIIGLSLVFQLAVGFLIAALMKTSYVYCKDFVRAVIFFPVVLSPVVVALVWFIFYGYDNGILNHFLDFIGLSDWKRAWLSDPDIVIYAVAVPIVWQFIGLFFVIFAAGLSKIDESLIEAAHIDGAGFFKTLLSITLPLMIGTWRVALILAFSGGLKIFEHIFVMTNGGPGLSSTVAAQYAYNQAIMRVRFDYASTVAISIVIISFLLMGLIYFITDRFLKKYE